MRGRLFWAMLISIVAFHACTVTDVQLEGLKSLYYSTNGSGWNVNVGWNSLDSDNPTDPCIGGWYGVSCDPTFSDVLYLSLDRNDLRGTIPQDFGRSLTQLIYLDLGINKLQNEIPSTLSLLSYLKRLDISNNFLSGELSDEFFRNMSSLSVLDLRNNRLSGPIPSSLFYAAKNITYIDLTANFFIGSVPPQISRSLQLESFLLARNNCSGSMSDFSNLNQLTVLDLNRNNFTGDILAQFFPINGNLTYLDLSYNQFQGSLDGLASVADQGTNSFQTIDISHNFISGSLPQSLICPLNKGYFRPNIIRLSFNRLTGQLPYCDPNQHLQSLKQLHLDRNSISGSLSSNLLFSLNSLEELSIRQNQLTGPLPYNLFYTSLSLRQVFLSDNLLSGSFAQFEDGASHTEIKTCSNLLNMLQSLYIDDNYFTGPLSLPIANLSGLQYFSATGNSFHGPIPHDIGNLTCMKSLDLGENLLSSRIPESLMNLPLLNFLMVDSNRISGAIPTSISNLINLQGFSAQSNYMTGSIPLSIGKLTNLSFLIIADNFIGGEIPDTIGSLTELTMLVLDHNLISGALPPSIGNLSDLNVLSAANNLLTGVVSELWDLVGISRLVLSDNQLHGRIDSSIGCMRILEDLDLENNRFTGPIPSSISNLKNLVNLHLQNNYFTGKLPQRLLGLPRLRSFLISNAASTGGLSGSIGVIFPSDNDIINYDDDNFNPSCIFDDNSIILDVYPLEELVIVANSDLTGHIPSAINRFTMLDTLIIAGNSISGSISFNWSDFVHLTQLDLSFNRITGDLPISLSSLSNITTLSLSSNYISGAFEDLKSSELSWSDFKGQNIETFDVSSNFLSCSIPDSFLSQVPQAEQDSSVKILSGNIYSCPISNSVKKIDNVSSSYSCGSSAQLAGLITFGISGFVFLIAIVIVKLKSKSNTMGKHAHGFLRTTNMQRFDTSQTSSDFTRSNSFVSGVEHQSVRYDMLLTVVWLLDWKPDLFALTYALGCHKHDNNSQSTDQGYIFRHIPCIEHFLRLQSRFFGLTVIVCCLSALFLLPFYAALYSPYDCEYFNNLSLSLKVFGASVTANDLKFSESVLSELWHIILGFQCFLVVVFVTFGVWGQRRVVDQALSLWSVLIGTPAATNDENAKTKSKLQRITGDSDVASMIRFRSETLVQPSPKPMKSVFFAVCWSLLALSVALCPNIAYVLLISSSSISNVTKQILVIIVSFAKLFLSSVALPRIATQLSYLISSSDCRNRFSKTRFALNILFSAVTLVIIPIILVLLLSPQCFQYVFWPLDNRQVVIDQLVCNNVIVLPPIFPGGTETVRNLCIDPSQRSDFIVTISYAYPFRLSPMCASAIVGSFAPVMIAFIALQGILEPALWIIVPLIHKKAGNLFRYFFYEILWVGMIPAELNVSDKLSWKLSYYLTKDLEPTILTYKLHEFVDYVVVSHIVRVIIVLTWGVEFPFIVLVASIACLTSGMSVLIVFTRLLNQGSADILLIEKSLQTCDLSLKVIRIVEFTCLIFLGIVWGVIEDPFQGVGLWLLIPIFLALVLCEVQLFWRSRQKLFWKKKIAGVARSSIDGNAAALAVSKLRKGIDETAIGNDKSLFGEKYDDTDQADGQRYSRVFNIWPESDDFSEEYKKDLLSNDFSNDESARQSFSISLISD